MQLWQWATGKELAEAQADAVHAQAAQARRVRRQPPPGRDEQQASGHLLRRRNYGRDDCQLFRCPIAADAGHARADFDAAWNCFARQPAEGVGEPASLRTATVDGWTMHAATAAGQCGGQPHQIVLSSFMQGRAQRFAVCVFTKAAQAAATTCNTTPTQVRSRYECAPRPCPAR